MNQIKLLANIHVKPLNTCSTIFALIIFLFHIETIASAYKDGYQLAKDYSELVTREGGDFVEVPIDHAKNDSRKIPIYYHFVDGKFDTKKPTMIIFTGGPGAASHFSKDHKIEDYKKLPYNVMLFDQRGMGFSKPLDESDYLNTDFYSSENTARDVEEVRKKLNIQKISVYGGSYGTIPATIYASLFPKSSRSLVLEGTFYGGYGFYQNSQYAIKKTDAFIKSLDELEKAKVDDISKKMPEAIPILIKSYMMAYGEKGLSLLRQKIREVESAEYFVDELYSNQPNSNEIPEILRGDSVSHNILSCKELGLNKANISLNVEIKDMKSRWVEGPGKNWYLSTCERLNLVTDEFLFNAQEFKVNVPTYYLQGKSDPATTDAGASAHYNAVPTSNKYYLRFEDLGHTPIGQILSNKTSQSSKIFSILTKALAGNSIDKQDITSFNESGNMIIEFFSSKEDTVNNTTNQYYFNRRGVR